MASQAASILFYSGRNYWLHHLRATHSDGLGRPISAMSNAHPRVGLPFETRITTKSKSMDAI
jgi:hypothetical protein